MDVRILNLRPPEIAAAWERGNIDATYIWDPVLAKVKKSGTVVASAGDLARRGKATFDGWWSTGQVRAEPGLPGDPRQGARRHRTRNTGHKHWNADAKEVKAVARITGSNAGGGAREPRAYGSRPGASRPPRPGSAAPPRGALTETAEFLKAQGRSRTCPGLRPVRHGGLRGGGRGNSLFPDRRPHDRDPQSGRHATARASTRRRAVAASTCHRPRRVRGGARRLGLRQDHAALGIAGFLEPTEGEHPARRRAGRRARRRARRGVPEATP